MVPYGPNIDVPGFPRFFGWKATFLQHSNIHPSLQCIEGLRNMVSQPQPPKKMLNELKG